LEVEGQKRKKEENEKQIDFELQRNDPGKYLRTEDPKEYLARGLGKLLLWAVWVIHKSRNRHNVGRFFEGVLYFGWPNQPSSCFGKVHWNRDFSNPHVFEPFDN